MLPLSVLVSAVCCLLSTASFAQDSKCCHQFPFDYVLCGDLVSLVVYQPHATDAEKN